MVAKATELKATRHVLYDRWRGALLWRTFFTTSVVAIVLRALIEICWTGEGGLVMFDIGSVFSSYGLNDLLPVIILGIIGGLLGSLFNYLLEKILRFYNAINERGPPFKILLTCTISLLTTCCAFGLPWLATCTPCPPSMQQQCPTLGGSGNFKIFTCPSGHYNDLATLLLNTNNDAIRNLFSSNTTNEFHLSTLLIFFTTTYTLTLFTYGLALPAGLFIPAILAGASYGRLAGKIFRNHISNVDLGLFALLGSASFLGGTMRMTISVCIILVELTNNLSLHPLVMLVLLVSKTVADHFNRGVYDEIVRIKGLPYLEAHTEAFMEHLAAGDIVSGPLVMFHGVEKVGDVLHVLRSTGHNGFPVIDEPPFSSGRGPELCGLVLRSHLLVLLMGKRFLPEKKRMPPEEVYRWFDADAFAKKGLGKGPRVEELVITDEEMEMYVDLHPVTNTSPHTVVETMPLAKAAVLFRQLGLRHLCVVPKTPGGPPIAGILTRHDFMPEHILELYPQFKQGKWN